MQTMSNITFRNIIISSSHPRTPRLPKITRVVQASSSSSSLRFRSPSKRLTLSTTTTPQHYNSAAPKPPLFAIKTASSAELGLASIFLVLSMVFAAMCSLVTVSIPTMIAFRRLVVSADKLSKVVSEEVPSTMVSFKLSGLEISDLTEQLRMLRKKITSSRYGKKVIRSENPSSRGSDNQ